MSPRKGFLDQPSEEAVIYARFSSHAQREVSIEQQIEECMAYAARNNLKVIDTYVDKAITGKTDRRTSFQRMLRDAERGKFRVILAYKSNRIARYMLHALTYEERLAKLGVKILYAKEEFGDTAAGRFALRTMMNVNQFYSENMSEDIRRGLRDNAQNCMVCNGHLPLGYTKTPELRYALDPAGAAVVREIYRKFLDGVPLVDIAGDLNARGIKTSSGGPWNRSSFHRLLTNERYTGVYIYGDVRIEGGVPQIIERDDWLMAQERLKTKPRAAGRHRDVADYLLTGKLFCGQCGTPMVGICGTGKSGSKHYYYTCNRRRLKHSCEKKNVRRDYIEDLVVQAAVDHVLQPAVMEWMADCVVDYQRRHKSSGLLSGLQVELDDVRRRLKNLMDAVEQGIVTPTTKERLEELEADQVRLGDAIIVEKKKRPRFTREQIIFWLEHFRAGDAADPDFRREIVRSFVNAVYVYDDHLRIAFNFCAGGHDSITRELAEQAGSGTGDPAGAAPGGGVCIESPMVHQRGTRRTPPQLYFVAPVFVLVLSLK